MMKISVIIPANNVGESIVKCLDSIGSQVFDKSAYEIVIVLDSCTDNTEEIVTEWKESHGDINLRMIHAECGSPGGARNVGLDNAAGEYVMFVDGDDYLINDYAMAMLCGAIQGHSAVRVTDHEVSGRELKFSERLTLWLHFFRRDFIGDDRFTDMLLNEDFEFVKRIHNKPGYNEAIINTPLYHYNYDNDRMVARIFKVMRLSHERAEQGLPPLFVDDEFAPEGMETPAGRVLIGDVNHDLGNE
ncbi:MAG: glycosyltransferase family 2 protein [Clostridia bacterium]|nr:glycosyltransferase family 2 protein [Clostridia bacterium]